MGKISIDPVSIGPVSIGAVCQYPDFGDAGSKRVLPGIG